MSLLTCCKRVGFLCQRPPQQRAPLWRGAVINVQHVRHLLVRQPVP